MNLEQKATFQGKIINKLTGRSTTVKFSKARINIYNKGKFSGWVKRSDFAKIKTEAKVSFSNHKYGTKMNFEKTVFEKPVSIKTGKMKAAKTRVMKVNIYTKSQAKFVKNSFKERKIPVNQKTPFQKTTDLRKKFKMANLRTSRFVKTGSP